jgi:hypothetical protein
LLLPLFLALLPLFLFAHRTTPACPFHLRWEM